MTTIVAFGKNGIAAIAADTFTQTRKSLENCLPLVYHAYLHHATATDIARTGVEAGIALDKNTQPRSHCTTSHCKVERTPAVSSFRWY